MARLISFVLKGKSKRDEISLFSCVPVDETTPSIFAEHF